MALRHRCQERHSDAFAATANQPKTRGHSFYTALNLSVFQILLPALKGFRLNHF